MKNNKIIKNKILFRATHRGSKEMDLLHSCRVENRQQGRVYLSSISGRYEFSMQESCDDHWEVVK